MSKMTIGINGTQIWRNEAGDWHREDGPAWVDRDGSMGWYQNNLPHRIDGQAFIGKDGTQVWWVNGKQHRTDGPAIIFPDGTEYWRINHVDFTSEVIEWMKDYSINPDWTKWTDQEKMWFKLRFGGISSCL